MLDRLILQLFELICNCTLSLTSIPDILIFSAFNIIVVFVKITPSPTRFIGLFIVNILLYRFPVVSIVMLDGIISLRFPFSSKKSVYVFSLR